MSYKVQDKFRGLMLGMACGDALGAQVEFKARNTFPRQVVMTGKGPHGLEPGQWTDDTAMALHLAQHLLVDEDVAEPGILANRWLRWYREGEGSCTGTCFDIGIQTSAALRCWEELGAAPLMDAERRGNGGLMRCAPAALAHPWDAERAATAAALQCQITHPDTCAMLCGIFTMEVCRALAADNLTDFRRDLSTRYAAVWPRPRSKVQSTGYDVHTFEAAIWCVLRTNNLKDAIVMAANLGDDADTVACVTGALAGALYGADSLPAQWLGVLAWRDQLTEVADAHYERRHRLAEAAA